MCNRVGADYDSIDFKSNDWYLSHTWTIEQERDFVNWMTDYLYANIQARREIMTNYLTNKKRCRKAADQFVFAYGWKYEDSNR